MKGRKTGGHKKGYKFRKEACQYCNKEVSISVIKRHEEKCYLNLKNLKLCPICNKPIKDWKHAVTCSYSCANKYFRTGRGNGNWKEDRYRTTCWADHKKECIICGEKNVVTVHHYDENHDNNNSENLVPLCSTHHMYMRSRYKYLIEKQVDDYVKNFIGM